MNPSDETRREVTRRNDKEGPDSYHGVVILEGLSDPSVLKAVRILGQRRAAEWTLLRVGVPSRNLSSTLHRIQRRLRIVNGVPFYAHFYRKNELIVVFPRRVFRLRPERSTWGPAVSYGGSQGIPEEELDFDPCRFEDETY